MSHVRLPSLLHPRPAGNVTQILPSVDELVRIEQPTEPLHCIRPAAITAATRRFTTAFAGRTLFAVKCNPAPAVLQAVWDGGVRHFDCASAGEVRRVRALLPQAAIHFMHPVKSRPAIREAYASGVRDYVLDAAGELGKILAETGVRETGVRETGVRETGVREMGVHETGIAADLGLIVRLALPRGTAKYDLSGKFGAEPEEAAALLHAARPHAARLGISFHVGSQCLDPLAYRRAIRLAGEVIRASGVAVDIVDVGGGFPVSYPDQAPPALGAYFAEIDAAFEALGLPESVALWAEPGRALVAGGASVVVQVQLRRGDTLYVNDGVYGSLSDAGAPGFRFPARLMRASDGVERGYALSGPTCDSADHMQGPFLLPDDVEEGDWIEIGQLGAYGACLGTAFNGFDPARTVAVRDAPMLKTPGL